MKIFNQPITGSEVVLDEATPMAGLIQFYQGFNARDLETVASNWLQSKQASMSNPLGGVKRGWDEIAGVYERIFNGAATVYVEFYDFSLHETESMFCAVGRERGWLEKDGHKLELAIRTSRTFLKYRQGWKQLHHHGSMDNPKLLAQYQQLVSGRQEAV